MSSQELGTQNVKKQYSCFEIKQIKKYIDQYEKVILNF